MLIVKYYFKTDFKIGNIKQKYCSLKYDWNKTQRKCTLKVFKIPNSLVKKYLKYQKKI